MTTIAFYEFKEGWDHKTTKGGPGTKAYYWGHTFRFLAAIAGTAIDVILQVAQVASLTFEHLLIKAETKIRGVRYNASSLGHFFYEEGMSATAALYWFRIHTTINEPGILAKDLQIPFDFNIITPYLNRLSSFLFP